MDDERKKELQQLTYTFLYLLSCSNFGLTLTKKDNVVFALFEDKTNKEKYNLFEILKPYMSPETIAKIEKGE